MKKTLEKDLFDDYIALALRTESKIDGGDDLNRIEHSLMGMVTEVAEMMDNVKKHRFYGKDIDYVNLREELGDLMRYVAILLDTLDISMKDILASNIEKLKVRYPQGFSEEDAEYRNIEKEKKLWKVMMICL